ncbi:MAG: hypothetical protein IH881_12250 [Myxococcales bacterium]|nr:hypothetical protein [Myxococcales bacterium]
MSSLPPERARDRFAAPWRQEGIDWGRVTCFNIDDFWDRRLPREFTCGYQTERDLYAQVPCKAYHLVDYKAADPEAEARRFEALVREGPIDVVCQGIGTSGHLALNEPGDTDFGAERWVRRVELVAAQADAAQWSVAQFGPVQQQVDDDDGFARYIAHGGDGQGLNLRITDLCFAAIV